MQGELDVGQFTDRLAQQIQDAPARLSAALDKASKQLESNTAGQGSGDGKAGQQKEQ